MSFSLWKLSSDCSYARSLAILRQLPCTTGDATCHELNRALLIMTLHLIMTMFYTEFLISHLRPTLSSVHCLVLPSQHSSYLVSLMSLSRSAQHGMDQIKITLELTDSRSLCLFPHVSHQLTCNDVASWNARHAWRGNVGV